MHRVLRWKSQYSWMKLHKPDLARFAGYAAVAIGAAIPISVSLTSVLVGLTVLMGLISGIYTRHWKAMLSNPVALTALLLFTWLALTMLYTEAPMSEAFRVLKKYRELLLIPLLLPLFMRPELRVWGIWAFMLAALVMLVGSYTDGALQLIEGGVLYSEPAVLKSRITQSTLLAFAAYWLTLQLEQSPGWRWLWSLLIGLVVFNIFFMIGGRTGLLIFLALAGLLLFQRSRWKGLAVASIGGALLLLGAYVVSDSLQKRVQESWRGWGEYQAGDYSTSTTLRLSFLDNSLELVADRPLLGYGVGSFASAYNRRVEDTAFPPTENPHNEFLLIGVQAGLIGILLFVALFVQQLRLAPRLPARDRKLAQALVITMGMGCLLNSFLMDSTEGHFFAFFSALLFAHLGEPEEPKARPVPIDPGTQTTEQADR